MLEAPAEQIAMRGQSHGLLEGARKMVRGKSGEGGQGVEADLLVEMGLDEFADGVLHGWREAAAADVRRFRERQITESTQPGLRVNDGLRRMARRTADERRSDQDAPLIRSA